MKVLGGADESDPGYYDADALGNRLVMGAAILTPVPEAEAAAEGTTTLYRAVTNAKFEQIMRTGTFEQGPNALVGKMVLRKR